MGKGNGGNGEREKKVQRIGRKRDIELFAAGASAIAVNAVECIFFENLRMFV